MPPVIDGFISRSLSSIVSGIVVFLITQAIFGLVWLTNMSNDVNKLKEEHAQLTLQIKKLDEVGSRPLDLIRNRQLDNIAANKTQDDRLRDLENKLNMVETKHLETRFLVEQLKAAISTFSHPSDLEKKR